MADGILIDYIAGSFRTKSTNESLRYSADVLCRSAATLHLLHADSPHPDELEELCSKAKALVQSKNPASKCAGLEALSAFASEGSRATFLSEFSGWATDALAALKAKGEGDRHQEDVHQAAWSLLVAIFDRAARLVHVPGVRRDGASLAPSLSSLVLLVVSENQPSVLPKALKALYSAIIAVPSAFRHHIKQLEQPVADVMLRGGVAGKIAASCFAALPRAAGDADTWSTAAQRLLVTSHTLLDQVLLGLEPQGMADSCKQALDPSATALTLPHSASGGALRAYSTAFSQLESVIGCLHTLLSVSYPSPVPIPSHGLMLLTIRGLSVDASSASGRASASGGQLAELCLHLPEVHGCMLRLLRAKINTCGTQLLPLLGSIGRLLQEQLGRVEGAIGSGGTPGISAPPTTVRIALYETVHAFLHSGGMAAARQLGPALLGCAHAEIYGSSSSSSSNNSIAVNGTAARGAMPAPPPRKKSKRSKANLDVAIGDQADNAGAVSEEAALRSQAAVLAALEVLLSSGAALLTPEIRGKADNLVAHAASTVADAVHVAGQNADGNTAPLKPLQLAAYRALLASVLAPSHQRPSHLPLALKLFTTGLRNHDSAVASFSSTALLSCEALLHPRSHPPAVIYTRAGDASVSNAPGALLSMPHFWSHVDAAAAHTAHAASAPQNVDDDESLLPAERISTAQPTSADAPAPAGAGTQGQRQGKKRGAASQLSEEPAQKSSKAAPKSPTLETNTITNKQAAPELPSWEPPVTAAAVDEGGDVAPVKAHEEQHAPAAAPLGRQGAADLAGSDSDISLPEIDSGGESSDDE